jgi:uncharacterized protein YjbJ (UPF0337 family)
MARTALRGDAGTVRPACTLLDRDALTLSNKAPRGDNEAIMSNASKRSEGMAEEVGGKIKSAVGKLVGNERMQAEGKAREAEGKAKQEAAKAAERAEGKTEEVVGTVKNRVGAAVGNDRMQAEGKVEELKGEARQQSNR